MHNQDETTDLLSDLETYRLWQSIMIKDDTDARATSYKRGAMLERRVFHQLYALGFRTLAGRVRELRGLSGIAYENDVLVFKPGSANKLLIVECKFRKGGSMLEKDQVLLFYQRMQDILMFFVAAGYPKAVLPLLVSSVPLDRNAFRFCLTYGILSIHPCYETSSTYSPMVACRPPLAGIRHMLDSAQNEKTEYSESIRGLTKSISRLLRYTVRYVSPFHPFRAISDGNRLEKTYFDILYRSKSVLGNW